MAVAIASSCLSRASASALPTTRTRPDPRFGCRSARSSRRGASARAPAPARTRSLPAAGATAASSRRGTRRRARSGSRTAPSRRRGRPPRRCTGRSARTGAVIAVAIAAATSHIDSAAWFATDVDAHRFHSLERLEHEQLRARFTSACSSGGSSHSSRPMRFATATPSCSGAARSRHRQHCEHERTATLRREEPPLHHDEEQRERRREAAEEEDLREVAAGPPRGRHLLRARDLEVDRRRRRGDAASFDVASACGACPIARITPRRRYPRRVRISARAAVPAAPCEPARRARAPVPAAPAAPPHRRSTGARRDARAGRGSRRSSRRDATDPPSPPILGAAGGDPSLRRGVGGRAAPRARVRRALLGLRLSLRPLRREERLVDPRAAREARHDDRRADERLGPRPAACAARLRRPRAAGTETIRS